MARTEFVKEYHEKMYPGYVSAYLSTDPEFIEMFENFAFDQLIHTEGVEVDERTRYLAWLSSLLGANCGDEFRLLLPAALNMGVEPVELREMIYQAIPYVGLGQAYLCLKGFNEVLRGRGTELPLPPQKTIENSERKDAGTEVLVRAFGEDYRSYYDAGHQDYPHFNRWAVENCFGDYLTRSGLSLKDREMITFCMLAGQGCCGPQLKAHIAANLHVGNSREFLIRVISQCVPYIGYPKCMNALTFLDEVCGK